MRIPLDYYRILGIPLQVSEDQIRQSYQDRLIQLPRSEYSEVAIASRNELLEQAYNILSDEEQRISYTEQWWGNPQAISSEFISPTTVNEEINSSAAIDTLTPQPPGIEITPFQLVGALLIFQELGEYELVQQYGQSALRNPETKDEFLNSHQDLVLTVALADLELSREQWQQQEYEKAAYSGFKALAWLQEENLFPTVQQEIRNELYRLRPYRILEHLADDQDQNRDRPQGLQLLKEMIQDRQGIEGKGNDRSGLGTDDFLRFVQQLRNYLTVDEQLDLFVEESERPSLAASYFAIYALIAKGFTLKKPSYLIQCQSLINKLNNRQDVALEEAICALLLGQTQLASQSLEKTQDQKALALIRERSLGSPDLLPGLCSYGENWLESEIFSHFRDLIGQKASLEDYFADVNVQIYLETISSDSLITSITSSAVPSPTDLGSPMVKNSAEYQDTLPDQQLPRKRRAESHRSRPSRHASVMNEGVGTATLTAPNEGINQTFAPFPDYSQPIAGSFVSPTLGSSETDDFNLLEESVPVPRKKIKRKRKITIKPVRFGLVLLSSLAIIGATVFGVQSMRSPLNALQSDQLDLALDQSPIEMPNTASAQAHLIPTGELTKDVAQTVIENWLASKAKAFGQDHDLAPLSAILAEPLLSQWQRRAEREKQRGNYRQYDHKIEMKSLQFNPDNPNQATIQARIQEATKYYIDKADSQPIQLQNDDLLVRYQLIRQNDQWLIQTITAQSSR